MNSTSMEMEVEFIHKIGSKLSSSQFKEEKKINVLEKRVCLFVWLVVGKSTPKGTIKNKVGRKPTVGE